MWKVVENIDQSGMRGGSAILSACSACAGDYEDPDWTAPHDDASEEPAGREDDAAEAGQSGPASAEGFLCGDRMPQE